MKTYLFLAQVVVAVALSALVLLQAKDAGLSNMFGGSDMGVYRTRRGVEKTLFNATIGLTVVYVLLSMVTVFLVG